MEAFKIFDRDDDKTIEAREIYACIRNLNSERESEVLAVLKRFENQEGKISYDELVTSLLTEAP